MEEITIKTQEEINKLREGGKILALIMNQLVKAVRPGIKTQDLEDLARKLMSDYKVKGSFLDFGEPPYPAVLCTSVNEELVHCIPGKKIIKEGDILSLDCGIWHKGLCTDHAVTVPVGRILPEAKKLIKVTKKSLAVAIGKIKPGGRLGDMGQAVQAYVEKNGFGVIRKLVGHGVGYGVHEPPKIPNFGTAGKGEILKEGMVLAIEPMVAAGHYEIEVLANGWDIVTADRSLAAHFEHTVAVTKKGCEILTK